MARGRPKKPDAIKALEGNPGKRPLNGDAPLPVGFATKPDYVTGYAAEIWDTIVNSMPRELYGSCDLVILASFCVAAEQFKDATEQIKAEGLTVQTENGELKPHPALSAQSKANTTIALLSARLGLDPSSRASIKVPATQKPDSKFKGLLGVEPVSETVSEAN